MRSLDSETLPPGQKTIALFRGCIGYLRISPQCRKMNSLKMWQCTCRFLSDEGLWSAAVVVLSEGIHFSSCGCFKMKAGFSLSNEIDTGFLLMFTWKKNSPFVEQWGRIQCMEAVDASCRACRIKYFCSEMCIDRGLRHMFPYFVQKG